MSVRAKTGAYTAPDMCTELGITCRETEHTLREKLLDVAGLSELFRALSDETRTKILYLLSHSRSSASATSPSCST